MEYIRECSIEGCNRKHQALGMCDMHYQRDRASRLVTTSKAVRDIPGERWLPVAGYGGIYEVSDMGRLRGVRRRGSAGGVISPAMHPSGHLYVGLHNGVRTSAQLHRVVLEAFIGPCPDGMEALHINGNPADNRVGNLRWGTRSENQIDRVRHGTSWQRNKTHCPRGHILASPNLVPSGRGRGCLACKRATSFANYHGIPVTKQAADTYYEQIIAPERNIMSTPTPDLSPSELAEVTRFGIHEEDQEDEQ